jgi:hypothetical protein
MARSRKLSRRREQNLRTPHQTDLDESIKMIVDTARHRARHDHDHSFASDVEENKLVEVYLRRAHDQFRDEHE